MLFCCHKMILKIVPPPKWFTNSDHCLPSTYNESLVGSPRQFTRKYFEVADTTMMCYANTYVWCKNWEFLYIIDKHGHWALSSYLYYVIVLLDILLWGCFPISSWKISINVINISSLIIFVLQINTLF